MSSGGQEVDPSTAGMGRRRSSFADMFARQPSIDVNAANGTKSNAMATAMAQSQRSRRLSVSALGLSGSPTRASVGPSPFETLKDKSMGGRPRATSTTDETAVEDEDGVAPLNGESNSRPTSPSLARRLSFGAAAHRDPLRSSSGSVSGSGSGSGSGSSNPDMPLGSEGGGTSPGGASSPPGARKEGFNWSENLRNRAQRSSISFSQGSSGGFLPLTSSGTARAKAPEPISTAAPPPAKLPPKTPDHFQERILKGDFYMD